MLDQNKKYFVQIPDLSPGLFKLKASSGSFQKSVPLYFNAKRVTLLVQLSQPVYHPDGLVNFRVFAIDSRTQPLKVEHICKIWVLDPMNNQVRLWTEPKFLNGVFEGQLRLGGASEGSWKVLAEADGEVKLNRNLLVYFLETFISRLPPNLLMSFAILARSSKSF